ncbi:MAG: radical SAM protein, partial [Tyzzerella sp.]|nr:radical SAM protein [Tyzzerella sp.]
MRIQGLQKLTLLDYPEKTACTIFTAGCNFRCPFCHNASLVVHIPQDAEIKEMDFFSFLEKRKGVLDGVCVSGGEPLLQPDIEEFLRKIKDLGYAVKLDTNGSFPS